VKPPNILLAGGVGNSLIFCQATAAAVAAGVLGAGAMLLLEDFMMMCALVPVQQQHMT
jgi:hypothetical protein